MTTYCRSTDVKNYWLHQVCRMAGMSPLWDQDTYFLVYVDRMWTFIIVPRPLIVDLQVLVWKCNGEQHCTVDASDKMFGDPCKGHKKYLVATWDCTNKWGTCLPDVMFYHVSIMYLSLRATKCLAVWFHTSIYASTILLHCVHCRSKTDLVYYRYLVTIHLIGHFNRLALCNPQPIST